MVDKKNEYLARAMVCSHDPQVFNHINMCINENFGYDVMLKVVYSGVGKSLLNDDCNCLDILFLDINLRDVDCLTLAHRFHRANPDSTMVLLIDEPEQAILGYDMHAFKCLFKKDLYKELKQSLGEIRKELGFDRNLLDFHFVDKTHQVYADEILYAESQEHNISIHFCSKFRKPRHLFSTLTIVEEMLRPHGFSRISQSFIVNVAYIEDLTHEWVTLANGKQLPMGQQRFRDTKAMYQSYLEKTVPTIDLPKSILFGPPENPEGNSLKKYNK